MLTVLKIRGRQTFYFVLLANRYLHLYHHLQWRVHVSATTKNTFFAYIGFAIQIYQYRRDLSTRD